jgi:hypothetical protein
LSFVEEVKVSFTIVNSTWISKSDTKITLQLPTWNLRRYTQEQRDVNINVASAQQATSNNGSLFHTLVSILSHPLFNPTHPNSFTTMMKLSTLFATTTYLLSFVTTHVSAEDAYVYGKDPKKDAEYDISMGMAGIQQAAKDPKLLAQLFQDMQVSFFSSCFGGRLDCRCRRVFGG